MSKSLLHQFNFICFCFKKGEFRWKLLMKLIDHWIWALDVEHHLHRIQLLDRQLESFHRIRWDIPVHRITEVHQVLDHRSSLALPVCDQVRLPAVRVLVAVRVRRHLSLGQQQAMDHHLLHPYKFARLSVQQLTERLDFLLNAAKSFPQVCFFSLQFFFFFVETKERPPPPSSSSFVAIYGGWGKARLGRWNF